MKVTLIVPTVHKAGIDRIKPFWLPPLNLATVAATLPSDVEVEIIDENIVDIDFDIKTDIVGISSLTSQAQRAYEIASKFRKRGILTVIGGYHPSAVPEESAKYVDVVVGGEAEELWPKVIEDFRNNKLKKIYRHEDGTFPCLTDLKRPRRDLFQKGYQTINTIQTARGCPFNCEFCNISTFFGRKYRMKSIDDVVAEIKSMKKDDGDLFFFVDDEITANEKRATELFKAIKPLNIRWWSQATLKNMTRSKEFLQIIKDSGCFCMVVGIETLNAENLSSIGKSQNTREKYEEQFEMIRNAGIYLNPSFTFGYDNDTATTFEETYDFLMKMKVPLATFNILTPLPRTKLYQRLKEENRIICDDWSRYDMGHCVFEPKKITASELEEQFNMLSKKFYSINEVAKRLSFVRAEDKKLIFAWNMGYKRILDVFGVLM